MVTPIERQCLWINFFLHEVTEHTAQHFMFLCWVEHVKLCKSRRSGGVAVQTVFPPSYSTSGSDSHQNVPGLPQHLKENKFSEWKTVDETSLSSTRREDENEK